MSERLKIAWIYGISITFLLFSVYLLVQKDNYWLFALPLLIGVAVLYFLRIDVVFLMVTALTPFAVSLSNLDMGLSISLPTEPMMFGILLIFIVGVLHKRNYDKKLANHPISYVIYMSLLWMFFTSFTSEFPLVSFKFLLSRLWFVVPFYFVALIIFRGYNYIHWFVWAYATALALVVIITTVKHVSYGFNEEIGHWIMSPFYNDHTAYGAALAMFSTVAIGYLFYPGMGLFKRLFILAVTIVLVSGLFLSFSRAAWLSVAAALAVLIFVLLKIRFYWIVGFLALFITLFIVFQHEIIDRLEKNKQDSSANLVEHIQSISNISSDASNLERINRWQSAFRMYEQRPLLGWGPGTYQFVYAPFQRSKEKTIISTNAGDMGNAHSEYFGPLSEMGIPGMLIVLILVVYVVYTGLRIYKKSEFYEVRILALILTLSLITYFSHGLLNNFLDTDKLSVPFWGFIAAIVVLDSYYLSEQSFDLMRRKLMREN